MKIKMHFIHKPSRTYISFLHLDDIQSLMLSFWGYILSCYLSFKKSIISFCHGIQSPIQLLEFSSDISVSQNKFSPTPVDTCKYMIVPKIDY